VFGSRGQKISTSLKEKTRDSPPGGEKNQFRGTPGKVREGVTRRPLGESKGCCKGGDPRGKMDPFKVGIFDLSAS